MNPSEGRRVDLADNRKDSSDESPQLLGRGIRKVVNLFDHPRLIIAEAERFELLYPEGLPRREEDDDELELDEEEENIRSEQRK